MCGLQLFAFPPLSQTVLVMFLLELYYVGNFAELSVELSGCNSMWTCLWVIMLINPNTYRIYIILAVQDASYCHWLISSIYYREHRFHALRYTADTCDHIVTHLSKHSQNDSMLWKCHQFPAVFCHTTSSVCFLWVSVVHHDDPWF